jgi:hypothetical protein
MYVRCYLQGSENGRVVTIEVNIAKRNITTGLFGLDLNWKSSRFFQIKMKQCSVADTKTVRNLEF